MVDFAALTEQLRKKVHKVHAEYKCTRCGRIVRYVQVMPQGMMTTVYCDQYREHRQCRGRL